MKRLTELLQGKEDNYLMPFLWLHDDSEATLRHYIDRIHHAGIRAFCVESRPHPEFVGDKWWLDMDIILSTARAKGMKVWILDDVEFPTGSANGRIAAAFPALRKKFLKIHQNDFVGPRDDASFLLGWALSAQRPALKEMSDFPGGSTFAGDSKIIGVIAAKVRAWNDIDPDTLVDVSPYLHDGVLYWDLPAGNWRIFTLVETYRGGEKATEGWLNPLEPAATQVLIDTVYAPHYARFSHYFGNTLAGFFSDEPRLGNAQGADASIGRKEMVLPWCDELPGLLSRRLGQPALPLLPLLACQGGNQAHAVRYAYMDIVSRLYSEQFTGQLAHWCHQHGIKYAGHLIEDNNAHARLGYGAGHFFRAQWGQDLSGIDVVLGQIIPGMDKGYFKSFTTQGWDGEFFHYVLARMGASLAALDPAKKGRALVEIFGAYGWAEGLKMMKWLANHMLVRGINFFIPHAFSTAPFPDPDCPPHFYADGNDPQYRYLPLLSLYMNRAAHLLSGGESIVSAALLYHADAEWSGEYMLCQQPARELTQAQIGFDIVPVDSLLDAGLNDGRLQVNERSWPVLIIPASEALPAALLNRLPAIADQGVNICFIERWPVRSSENKPVADVLAQLQNHPRVQRVPLADMVRQLTAAGLGELRLATPQAWLRFYHYRQPDADVYMFFNESPSSEIDTTAWLPQAQPLSVYHVEDNALAQLTTRPEGGNALQLAPGEACFWLSGVTASPARLPAEPARVLHLNDNWLIALADATHYPRFENRRSLAHLTNLASPDWYPDFSGTVSYEKEISLVAHQYAELTISDAWEVVEVFIDEQSQGIRLSPPYRFPLRLPAASGTARLRIEVTNTLVKNQKDYLSHYLIQEPTGITGDICLRFYG